MRRSLLAGVALLSLLAVPTFAAEIPVQARPKPAARPVAQPVQARPVQTTNWSGSQVGGFNGGSNMSNAFVEPGAFLLFAPAFSGEDLLSSSANTETPFDFKRHPWSYTIGAFYGYNVQLGAWVVGGETDIAWKNAQSSNALYATTPAFYEFFDTPAVRTESFNGTLKQTWDGSLRARAGFLVTPDTLIYATGGLAYGEVRGSFAYSAQIVYPDSFGQTVATSGSRSWSDTRVGWTAGGGIETALTPGFLQFFGPAWKARIEYRYTDLGHYSKSIPLAYSSSCGSCDPTTASSAAIVNLHPTFHTIRVGLGYNF
jgi:outer membrane immunogenic protein